MAEDAEERIAQRGAIEADEHDAPYQAIFGDVSKIIDAARESVVRSANAAITAAYWLTGRRIVEFEQSGEERAAYGAALIERLAEDLTGRFGRGFSRQNIQSMRLFYLLYPPSQIRQTPSGISEAVSVEEGFDDLLAAFPLPCRVSASQSVHYANLHDYFTNRLSSLRQEHQLNNRNDHNRQNRENKKYPNRSESKIFIQAYAGG